MKVGLCWLYGRVFVGEVLVSRYFARLLASIGGTNFLSNDVLAATHIDYFIDIASSLIEAKDISFESVMNKLDTHLVSRTFLVGTEMTLADLLVWSALVPKQELIKNVVNVKRWFEGIMEVSYCREAVPTAEGTARAQAEKAKKAATGSLDIGISKDQKGKIVTRFPPEPSGYMHIGHAKAAMLNHYYASEYEGKLILRFDDTNPSKEEEEYEDAIKQDLKTLGINHDIFSHTSDHFDTLLQFAERMIREGLLRCLCAFFCFCWLGNDFSDGSTLT